jgi:lipoic acid synthetase
VVRIEDGEVEERLRRGDALRDIAADRTDILTIGQYLQPTPQHWPVARWVHPEEFGRWKEFGLGLGIGVIESGAMVRSSYHADEQSLKYTGFGHRNDANALANDKE